MCVDLMTDLGHCGACANACGPLPGGSPACVGGACVVGSCDDGRLDCDRMSENGCEVDGRTDAMNCAGCGTVCDVAHGMAVCQEGVCALGSCTPGWGDCNKSGLDGCESNLGQDSTNCGTCGHACSGPNSVQGCQMGTCHVDSCAKGFSDC